MNAPVINFLIPFNEEQNKSYFYTHSHLYPPLYNLLDSLKAAIVLSILRLLYYKFLLKPISLCLVKEPTFFHSSKKLEDNPILENYFLSCKRPDEQTIHTLSVKTNLTHKAVSNWFRIRRNKSKSSVRAKFIESGWRFTYYLVMFTYGAYVLHDEPYLYDTTYFFRHYPHYVTDEIHRYYMVELGLYVSALFWMFFEVKRTDNTVMIIHHIATIALMVLSYISCFTRIGSLILALHDLADIFMEAAKLCKYLSRMNLCVTLFSIFMVIWFLTRLFYFPFWIIHSVIYIAPKEIGIFTARKGFIFLLCTLQVLHIFWFVLIVRIAIQPLIEGKFCKDSRSDSEMSFVESDEENEQNLRNKDEKIRYRNKEITAEN